MRWPKHAVWEIRFVASPRASDERIDGRTGLAGSICWLTCETDDALVVGDMGGTRAGAAPTSADDATASRWESCRRITAIWVRDLRLGDAAGGVRASVMIFTAAWGDKQRMRC